MPTFEITSELNLSSQEKEQLDMHSFLNIMNVLIGQISIFELLYGNEEGFTKALTIANTIKEDLGNLNSLKVHINNLEQLEKELLEHIYKGFDAAKVDKNKPEIIDAIENITIVFEVLKVRAMEILSRQKEPHKWTAHNIKELTNNYIDVLAAIVKNGKGKYGITYNIAHKEPLDYIVDLNIESVDGDVLYMPPVMQDVLRDIIANARKYSDPGGRISAGLYDDGKHLKLVVKDEGKGIPDDEIANVVNYGERASNVSNMKTMGGGFGLTKAYFMTKQFGGRMWISSELNKGTTVSIEIPIKNSRRF